MGLQSIKLFNLRGGHNDRGDGIEIPLVYQQNLENFYVDRESIKTRNGYGRRHAAALVASNAVQAIHQYTDNSGSSYIFYACGGKLYRDPMTGDAPTDITGSLTLATAATARYHFADFNGQCYGTDGVNPLFNIASGSSNGADFSTPTPGMPSRASVLNFHKLHMWLGDFEDTDGDEQRYSTIHSSGGVPIVFTGRMESGASNDYNRTQTVKGLKDYGDVQLIFLNGSIWLAEWAPARDLGMAQSNFTYRQLDSRVGLAAAKSIVDTPQGLFFLGKRGIYWIPPGYPIQRPRYISKPIEDFWADVEDQTYLPYAVGAEMPEKNGVLFCVPYGSSQATNNRGIFLNYESWSQWGQDANDTHPAFSIFSGRSGQPFAFNALATITDSDGRERLLGGDYSGFIHDLDDGSLDVATSIQPKVKFPYVGSPDRESHWHQLILDADIENEKYIQAIQSNFDRPTPHTQAVLAGDDGILLGDFMLDEDFIGGDTLGPVRADLVGVSRYMELEIEILSGAPFTLHGATILYEPGDMLL